MPLAETLNIFIFTLESSKEWTQCNQRLLNPEMNTHTKPLSVLCGAWGGGLVSECVDAIGSIQMSVT